MKQTIVITVLVTIASAIGFAFWYNEWKYSLPAPQPHNYKAIALGTTIDVSKIMKQPYKKSMLLHFFNPDCPCSKFNIENVKRLQQLYGNKMDFVIIAETKKAYTAKQIQDEFGLDIPVVFDASIAGACGVYSTPQAVILNENRQLIYRGNYNRSRYCTNTNSNYVQITIDSLLNHKAIPDFGKYAFISYGCTLPKEE